MTSELRIARLYTIAELTVRALGVVWCVHADIVDFVARIDRTTDSVATIRRCSGLAIVVGIAQLNTVTELTVVANAVVSCMGALVVDLIAGVERTRNAVVAIGHCARLTTVHRVANFIAVAIQTVIAESVVRRVHTHVRVFVTRIHSTVNGVITIRRGTRQATVDRIAHFRPVTIQAVAARAVVRRIGTHICVFVALIDRARNSVVAIGRRASLATEHRIAEFNAVAELRVVARTVIGRINADVVDFVARIDSTTHSVIAVRRGTGLAIVERIACLRAVAVLTVRTVGVHRKVVTRVGRLVTGVCSTRNVIVAIGRRTGLAIVDRVAKLYAIAVHAVVARSVIRGVDTDVIRLVARVVGTAHAIITVGRRAGLAIINCVTELDAVAEVSVVTQRICGRVDAHICHFVAGVDRA